MCIISTRNCYFHPRHNNPYECCTKLLSPPTTANPICMATNQLVNANNDATTSTQPTYSCYIPTQ